MGTCLSPGPSTVTGSRPPLARGHPGRTLGWHRRPPQSLGAAGTRRRGPSVPQLCEGPDPSRPTLSLRPRGTRWCPPPQQDLSPAIPGEGTGTWGQCQVPPPPQDVPSLGIVSPCEQGEPGPGVTQVQGTGEWHVGDRDGDKGWGLGTRDWGRGMGIGDLEWGTRDGVWGQGTGDEGWVWGPGFGDKRWALGS